MYAEGKRVVVNSELIKNAQKRYSEIIATSSLVVLVGIKYIAHDVHIFIFLSDGVALQLIRPTLKGRLVKPKAPPNRVLKAIKAA